MKFNKITTINVQEEKIALKRNLLTTLELIQKQKIVLKLQWQWCF